MPRSEYFNHVANTNERNLLLDLSQEVINLHGVDVWFIPNTYVNVDDLYGEDRKPNLTNAIKIVVHVPNAAGYEGNPEFSKFGFFNPANLDLVVSRKEWQDVAGTLRPTEGSIIYVPAWDSFGPTDFLKVDFVDKFEVGGFFPLGIHHTFTLQCSKWAYSSEDISTGVDEIDTQIPNFTNDIVINPNGNPTDHKDNAAVITRGNAVISFDENNPFGNPV
jgi:hypothetical protein